MQKKLILQFILFAASWVCLALAGVQWLNLDPFEVSNIGKGATYAALLMAILCAHEGGHYFLARSRGINATLPFFLPVPPFFGIATFGTFGAVIMVKNRPRNSKDLFDMEVAGPIAGLAVSLVILAYGFASLPPRDYLLGIHPEYSGLQSIPTSGLTFGPSILFNLFKVGFAPLNAFVPPMNEIYHYPFLCAGWFGLTLTAFNLIPIGSLDGGQVLRAAFPRFSRPIEWAAVGLLALAGLIGLVSEGGPNSDYVFSPAWLLWALILALVFLRSRRVSLSVGDLEGPADVGVARKGLAIVSGVVLLLTFVPSPVSFR
jgi:membrane-associated protease RseP (regulator of RpoE activity)